MRSLTAASLAATFLCSGVAPAQPLNWSQRTVPGPSARFEPGMAYDSDRNVMVLQGGNTGSNAGSNETWEWDGLGAWTHRVITLPGTRYGNAMVYDSLNHVTVQFGGNSGTPNFALLGDTWEWNGSVWAQKVPFTSPSGRYEHAMAFDSGRGVTVLFGGKEGSGGGMRLDNDTWEYSSTGDGWWAQRTADGPSARCGHAMAYDASRGVTVLFGGRTDNITTNDETWEWDGNAGTWTRRMVPAPPARFGHTMAYDPVRHVVVLFGGNSGTAFTTYYNDAWEWNGTVWARRITPATPSVRYESAMAYDALHGQMVVFGGGTSAPVNQTWVLWHTCGSADFNGDGDSGTDADIEAFFACVAGNCCATCDPHGADFNGDGDSGTDADIEAFFRVLAGGSC